MKKLLFYFIPIVLTILGSCEKTACGCYQEGVALETQLKEAPEEEKNEILQDLNKLIKECYESGIREEDFNACD